MVKLSIRVASERTALEIVVVSNDRRDRGKKPGGGGDQRFGDARRDDAKTRGARGAQAFECVHHAQNGSEQADEWRNRTDRRERGHPRSSARTSSAADAVSFPRRRHSHSSDCRRRDSCPTTWLCNSRNPASYRLASGEPPAAARRVRGSARPRPERNTCRNFLVCGSMRLNSRDFERMMAHEKRERKSRIARTIRAIQPVCSTSA